VTPTLLLLISFASDFVITAGSIVTGAMMEGGTVALPNRAVIVLALVMGVVVAARRAQALLQMPPAPGPTPEEQAATIVAQLRTQSPTPLRVALPEDPKPFKDSS